MSFTMVDLPEPVGPTMAACAGLGRKRRMGERRVAVVGVAEGDVVEQRCGRRPCGRPARRRTRVSAPRDRGRWAAVCEHLAQALGGHVGAGQHDGDHADDEAAHDDDHGVGDERDEVAGLDRVRGRRSLRADPHDEPRRRGSSTSIIGGHHERHDAVREQLCLHEARARPRRSAAPRRAGGRTRG